VLQNVVEKNFDALAKNPFNNFSLYAKTGDTTKISIRSTSSSATRNWPRFYVCVHDLMNKPHTRACGSFSVCVCATHRNHQFIYCNKIWNEL